MAETQVIKAEQRPARGKSGARAVRRENRVPGVIYGGDVAEQEPISVDSNELWKIINRGRFLATVLEIEVGGKKTKAIPRDVQLDPVRDTPVHVDFQRIGADGRVRVYVPVRFINEALSPGLKRGGVLNIVRHTIEVYCTVENIPQQIAVSLEGLDIGDSVHISAVKLPEGVRPTITGRDFTVAAVAAPSVLKSPEEEAAEAAAKAAATPAAGEAGAAPAAGATAAAPAAGAAAPAAGAKPAAAPAGGDKKAPAKK